MASLKTVLFINALSCLLFGAVFLFAAEQTSSFVGEVPVIACQALGLVLLINGAHLIVVGRRDTPKPLEIIWFSLGDFSWWLLTLGLVTAQIGITSDVGILTALVVASGVAMLGVLQLWFLGKRLNTHTTAEHFTAIGRSWMALPLWVKVWLILLNGAFLWLFVFWPSDFARITLIAFIATGPLLAGQLAHDGGLRRILGLAHLVPWVPFLFWLVVSNHDADTQLYTRVLGTMLAICLAFDIYDVVRFWKGDRATIGSTNLPDGN